MTRKELFQQMTQKQSYLCVGLDTDIQKIPSHLRSADDPIFEFNKQIIDATADFCVAYKPNTAFYEATGAKGWESLQKTLEYIPKNFFKIADAKRGDIGNTSGLYARAFFEQMQADAVTVAPYMGEDSVKPFLAFENKWVILLALTSNPGSQDFQTKLLTSEKPLFEQVITTAATWADADKLMYVVGATQAEQFHKIRQLAPDHFLLVPGVGAQGGDLQLLSQHGMNKQCGLLVNASRAIIYASANKDFAAKAAREAQSIQQEMAIYLEKYL
ncbi:orotidine-5'-phosphate decarboxylase [Rhodocytophaga aerolata]|uniref:Orotidine-5'-phosphate decarboxylase n=1 Tax=Rhodocytophaga aerolata TaxID=455078 RepID=A0ABT8R4S0_9BACT|nr:orotidine-5'-phosphate decarboxylase [Rhodocytophaga aerolata]MDO1447092.1 orotidine-5'-phosphate decarboxylase [Rhodocytophaga aerolata]